MEDLNLEVRESRAFKRNMFLVFISVPQSLVLKYRSEGEGLSVRIGGGGGMPVGPLIWIQPL